MIYLWKRLRGWWWKRRLLRGPAVPTTNLTLRDINVRNRSFDWQGANEDMVRRFRNYTKPRM